MADWAPLSSFFAKGASTPPPPMPPGMPPLMAGSRPSAGSTSAPFSDPARATLPEPPSLHWGLVLLFSVLTVGLFAIFWWFNQARWVRSIDPHSNSVLLLGISLTCFVIGEPLYLIGIFVGMHDGQLGNLQLVSLSSVLLFARWVLYLVAYFSMADSLKKALAARGASLHIGGPTLFFFPMLFMQANLSWVARWRSTGQTSPKPSKAVFWVTFLLLPFAIGMLTAIAIPAYQQYIKNTQLGQVRTQVSQGFVAADAARSAMLQYYESHHAFPSDNAAAGFANHASATHRFISGVEISGGAIIVSFDSTDAVASIRQKTLVLLPVVSNGEVRWNCSTYSTVPDEDLPSECQK